MVHCVKCPFNDCGILLDGLLLTKVVESIGIDTSSTIKVYIPMAICTSDDVKVNGALREVPC